MFTNVGGVAEHGEDHGPLNGELLDDDSGKEHARSQQGSVDHREGPNAQAVNLKKEKKLR